MDIKTIFPGKGLRKCSECKCYLWEGFCIENEREIYCSEECLEKNMTMEEFMDLYEDGYGDSYWTQWEDSDGRFDDEDDY